MPRAKRVIAAAKPPIPQLDLSTTVEADYYPMGHIRLSSVEASLKARVTATSQDGSILRANLIVTLPDGEETEIHGVPLVAADSREQGVRAVIRAKTEAQPPLQ